jgi:hypothetical protein
VVKKRFVRKSKPDNSDGAAAEHAPRMVEWTSDRPVPSLVRQQFALLAFICRLNDF